VGAGVGEGVGEDVGTCVGDGVGDGVGAATQELCPASPAVHCPAPHGAHAVLPALPANEPAGHAVHFVTLLSPSAAYTLCEPLKRPMMHGVHALGIAPRWQNEPAAQPAA
jgi:hypothetical protein